MGRLRFSVAGLMALVMVLALAFVSLRFASEGLAAAVLLLTLGILTLAILGIVYRAGAARASWLGFALFGWGSMVLSSGTWWDRGADRPELLATMVLDRLYPYLEPPRNPGTSAPWPGALLPSTDRLIQSKLDEPISMSFANETPLEDVLKYIKSATRGPNDNGIPIYVDPVGLNEAGKTTASPATLDLEGVPLRTTLTLLLRQLGLTYNVRNGLLTITNGTDSQVDAYQRIGHCYWALLAGCLGAIAGRIIHAGRDRGRQA